MAIVIGERAISGATLQKIRAAVYISNVLVYLITGRVLPGRHNIGR